MAASARGPTSVRPVHRIAHHQRSHAGREGGREFVVDGVGDDETLGRDAGLPVVDRARLRTAVATACSQVGARHHDERIAAAELENAFLDVPARRGRDRPAGRLAARQRHRGHAIVGDDPSTRSEPISRV